MSDYKITSLPEGIITIILGYNVITMEDIINFRCVCKKFRYAATIYNKFLEKKLSQRWPYAKKRYESLTEKEKEENLNFVIIGINSVTQLRSYLSQILFYDYFYNNRSNRNYFDDSIHNVLELENNGSQINRKFLQYRNVSLCEAILDRK
ncbi:uncharacterized protein LOC114939323 isoform X2 [Nylanderia fulva]|uniref:uncharacterized protein LOC114939323 isoform X2 n=1 Tax=Nylanderia fulva TaxID=613905 RepID=UPI0010FAFFE3|nr:uncharacterized protein LOC114939323 isoform X2 [Nylanderia fulva]